MAQWEPNLVDPKFGSYIMSLSMISVAQTASARRARELATTVIVRRYDLGSFFWKLKKMSFMSREMGLEESHYVYGSLAGTDWSTITTTRIHHGPSHAIGRACGKIYVKGLRNMEFIY